MTYILYNLSSYPHMLYFYFNFWCCSIPHTFYLLWSLSAVKQPPPSSSCLCNEVAIWTYFKVGVTLSRCRARVSTFGFSLRSNEDLANVYRVGGINLLQSAFYRQSLYLCSISKSNILQLQVLPPPFLLHAPTAK